MATRMVLEDDVSGGPADETLRFVFDGAEYEIDLSKANAVKFRKDLEKWSQNARRIGRKTRTAGKRTELGPAPAVLREWANANGYSVSDRGRVSQEVREAYAAAH